MHVFEFTLWWLDWFNQQVNFFESTVEAFLALFQTVLQQHFGIGAAWTVIQFRRINCDRILNFFEQVFVIHDVTEILVFAVEAVDAADRLEETVILHGLVDI